MANNLIYGTGGEQSPPDDEKPDRRVWMYRAGESRLFDSCEAVPAGEGWQDHPVPVSEPQTVLPDLAAAPLPIPEPLLPDGPEPEMPVVDGQEPPKRKRGRPKKGDE